MMLAERMPETKPLLSRPFWWAFFAAATALLSLTLETFKAFTLAPDWRAGLACAASIGLLVLVMLILSFDSYLKEKAKGDVKKPVRFFDWLEARLHTQSPPPTEDSHR